MNSKDRAREQLRLERDDVLAVLGLALVPTIDQLRVNDALDGDGDSFLLGVATGEVEAAGRVGWVAGARAPFCPVTTRPYRGPDLDSEHGNFDRDPWADDLADAVDRVALSPSVACLRHGDWILAVGSVDRNELAESARLVAASVRHEGRSSRFFTPRVVSGVEFHGYTVVDTDAAVLAPGWQAATLSIESDRFGDRRRSHWNVLFVNGPAWWTRLGGVSIDVSVLARVGLHDDEAVVGDRLARLLPPHAAIDRIVGSDNEGKGLRCVGPMMIPGDDCDESAVIAAGNAIMRAPTDVIASPGLNYARSHGLIRPDADESAVPPPFFRHRRCSTGPWIRSAGTHSMSMFPRPFGDGEPRDMVLLLAWGSAPGSPGRTVVEADASGVRIAEGGNSLLTNVLLNTLAEHAHESPGSRWFADGELLIAQIWWTVDETGARRSGLRASAVASVFNRIDAVLDPGGRHRHRSP